MRKEMKWLAVPALAAGVGVAASGEVEANEASAEGQASTEAHVQASVNGQGPVGSLEQNVSNVGERTEALANELEEKESLSNEEVDLFNENIDSLLNRLHASSNKIEGITTNLLDPESDDIIEVEETIEETETGLHDLHDLVNELHEADTAVETEAAVAADVAVEVE